MIRDIYSTFIIVSFSRNRSISRLRRSIVPCLKYLKELWNLCSYQKYRIAIVKVIAHYSKVACNGRAECMTSREFLLEYMSGFSERI